jgi:hypothetical protein
VAVVVVVVLVASGASGTGKHGHGLERSIAGTPATAVAPQSAPVVGIHIKVGKDPIGIAGDSRVLWVANHEASTSRG